MISLWCGKRVVDTITRTLNNMITDCTKWIRRTHIIPEVTWTSRQQPDFQQKWKFAYRTRALQLAEVKHWQKFILPLFSASLCLCLSVYLSLSVSVSVDLCLCLSLFFCLCLSVILSVSLSLSLSVSVCLSVCLSVFLPPSPLTLQPCQYKAVQQYTASLSRHFGVRSIFSDLHLPPLLLNFSDLHFPPLSLNFSDLHFPPLSLNCIADWLGKSGLGSCTREVPKRTRLKIRIPLLLGYVVVVSIWVQDCVSRRNIRKVDVLVKEGCVSWKKRVFLFSCVNLTL